MSLTTDEFLAQLLTDEEREELDRDLAEIARLRRESENAVAFITLGVDTE